jgi:hypothetical protein
VIWTPPRMIKPARWTAPGPRLRDHHLLRGCLALFPFWDGGGPDAIELLRRDGKIFRAQFEVSPSWGVGRAGPCLSLPGTNTGGMTVIGSELASIAAEAASAPVRRIGDRAVFLDALKPQRHLRQ